MCELRWDRHWLAGPLRPPSCPLKAPAPGLSQLPWPWVCALRLLQRPDGFLPQGVVLSSQPGPRVPCPVLGACPSPTFFLGGDTRRGVPESLGSQQTGEAGECWGIAAVGMGRWPGGAEEGSRSRCRAWLGPGRGRMALVSMCPFDPRVLGQETAGTDGSIGSGAFCTHSSLTPAPLGGPVLWSGAVVEEETG